MLVFQVIVRKGKEKDKQNIPKPTEVTLRERALTFIDELLKKMDKNPTDAVRLIEQAPSFQVTLSRKVFEKLKDAFSTEYETGFLLFADPKTHVIVEATEDSSKRKRSSISFDWNLTKEIIAEMEAQGLQFVGWYHSHTKPVERWKGAEGYDHTAISADDVYGIGVFPGTSLNIKEHDPDYQKIAGKNKLMLLGAVKDGEFGVRAFVPLNDYGIIGIPPKIGDPVYGEDKFPYQHAGRKITRRIHDEFNGVLDFKGIQDAFVKHYGGREVHLLEFKLDVQF